jgi:hypothetical protein
VPTPRKDNEAEREKRLGVLINEAKNIERWVAEPPRNQGLSSIVLADGGSVLVAD